MVSKLIWERAGFSDRRFRYSKNFSGFSTAQCLETKPKKVRLKPLQAEAQCCSLSRRAKSGCDVGASRTGSIRAAAMPCQRSEALFPSGRPSVRSKPFTSRVVTGPRQAKVTVGDKLSTWVAFEGKRTRLIKIKYRLLAEQTVTGRDFSPSLPVASRIEFRGGDRGSTAILSSNSGMLGRRVESRSVVRALTHHQTRVARTVSSAWILPGSGWNNAS
jgi:hypothetical protein